MYTYGQKLTYESRAISNKKTGVIGMTNVQTHEQTTRLKLMIDYLAVLEKLQATGKSYVNREISNMMERIEEEFAALK